MVDIRSQTDEELRAQFQAWGEPVYRVAQLLEWLYVHRVVAWDSMSNLPKSLRQRLGNHYTLRSLELVRKQGSWDTTQKFLWRLGDHSLIESVLIPASPALYGEPSDRHTLCISTQVGCAYGCRFCASGLAGWKRNLSVEEIVDQVLAIERWNMAQSQSDETGSVPVPGFTGDSRLVSNIVVMGMGEPLANYDNLLKALKILNGPWGCAIGGSES